MDIICINDVFDAEAIALIPNRPVKDKIYTIREVIPTSDGRIGLLLNEITNPLIPSGNFSFEPRFNNNRFTTLLGKPINKETIKELIKQTS